MIKKAAKGKHAGGRPIAENPLCIEIKVRFTAEDAKRLAAYCESHDIRRALAIREAVLRMLDDADGSPGAELIAAEPESPAEDPCSTPGADPDTVRS